jgi:hypothetical protein
MPHDVQKMVYVGEMPWHGLGARLPANATYDEIVEAAGFFTGSSSSPSAR